MGLGFRAARSYGRTLKRAATGNAASELIARENKRAEEKQEAWAEARAAERRPEVTANIIARWAAYKPVYAVIEQVSRGEAGPEVQEHAKAITPLLRRREVLVPRLPAEATAVLGHLDPRKFAARIKEVVEIDERLVIRMDAMAEALEDVEAEADNTTDPSESSSEVRLGDPVGDERESMIDLVSDQAIFGAAIEQAAGSIDGGSEQSFREERLERALASALADRFGTEAVMIRRAFPIPDWHGRLGGIDLAVRDTTTLGLRIAVELKIYNVEEALWDLFKMTAAASIPGVQATYLAVASTTKRWASGKDCTALFNTELGVPVRWDSPQMFDDWRAAWEWLTHPTKGGSARPVRVPRTVETTLVASHPVRSYPGYELKAIAVRPATGSAWLEFDGDWPAVS